MFLFIFQIWQSFVFFSRLYYFICFYLRFDISKFVSNCSQSAVELCSVHFKLLCSEVKLSRIKFGNAWLLVGGCFHVDQSSSCGTANAERRTYYATQG